MCLLKCLFHRLFIAFSVCTVLVAPSASAQSNWSIPKDAPLLTRWAKLVTPTNALIEYPRPQLQRDSWINLNGLWDYSLTPLSTIQLPSTYPSSILVPYPIESALSGVMRPLMPNERIWYHRTFAVPDSWSGQEILLHFGAVDWQTEVYVNGKDVGGHRGGYDEFSYNITSQLHPGVNEIVVAVSNPSDTGWQLRGKQVLHPGGASYTSASGIWQTVWLEPVPANHIESLKMVTDGIHGVIHLTVGARIAPGLVPFRVTVSDGKSDVAVANGELGAQLEQGDIDNLKWYKARSEWDESDINITIPNAHDWSANDPYLYDLTVSLLGQNGHPIDTVRSYTGIRTISLAKDQKGNVRLLINGKVTMLPMVLDQGYWPDGIYTAPTDDALKFDLEAEKSLGVSVRKHVKVEPDRWYYWADKLGVMVLQDMPTGNEGNPYTDEPTSPEAAEQCQSEMKCLIEQRWNHPSIISWNMFNEGWGQHDTIATAKWAKQLDPSRLIDEASGFPRHGAGDIVDCHGGIPPKSDDKISIDTEDGSVGVSSPGHDWPIGDLWTPLTYDPALGGPVTANGKLYPFDNESKTWMTRWVRQMFRSLWANTDSTGQTGDSYCQITDVETEEDGLISYDRAVWKVDPEPIRLAAEDQNSDPNAIAVLPTALTTPVSWEFTNIDPGTSWFLPKFDEKKWKTGLSAFGNGYDHIHTAWTDTPGDIWLRKSFTLTSIPARPFLRLIHDEEFQVYINGILAARDSGYIGSYDDYDIEPAAKKSLKIGTNLIAVHCHQSTGGQVIDVGLLDAQ